MRLAIAVALFAVGFCPATIRAASAASPEPGPSAAPSPLPSAAPSTAPSALPAVAPVYNSNAAQVVSLELRPPAKPTVTINLVPLSLPHVITESEEKNGAKIWKLPLAFESPKEEVALLADREAAKVAQGHAVLRVPAHMGDNEIHITVVDPLGNVNEYTARAKLAPVAVTQDVEPAGFAVVGPIGYERSISRSGSAIDPTSAHAFVSGVRGIYRRRLFKDVTDRLPGKFKIFADGSGTLAKTFGGDPTAQGTPIWADARLTLEVYQASGFRIEGGAGFSFFAPGLSQSQPGDLDSFFGFVLSLRVGYPFTDNLSGLLGFATSLPASDSGQSDILVSQPLEFFLSLSTPRGNNGYLELRLKYYQITTNGTVLDAGTFSRKESYFGPEFLWVFKI
jgi:hypothetical protein